MKSARIIGNSNQQSWSVTVTVLYKVQPYPQAGFRENGCSHLLRRSKIRSKIWELTLQYKEDTKRGSWGGIILCNATYRVLTDVSFDSALFSLMVCKRRSFSIFLSFWQPIQEAGLWTPTHPFPQTLNLSRAYFGSKLRTDGEGCCLRKAEITELPSGLNVLH